MSIDTNIKFNAHDNHFTVKKHEALRGKMTFPRSSDNKWQTHDLDVGNLTPESVLLATMVYSQNNNLISYKTLPCKEFSDWTISIC